ncbi:MAG: N-acetylmuramoyl-L-alanine amidase, partial [Gaiellaceae bacterium]
MRALRLAILVLLLTPALARASDVTMVARDVPLGGGSRSLSATTGRFNMVGLHWQGSGVPLLRARSLSGRWGPWLAADDDWGRDGSRWRKGAAEWTGPANAIQYRLRGEFSHLRSYLLWSPPEPQPVRRLALAGAPPIIPRLSWGADESIRRAPPVFADAIRFALVHHTVNTNGYTKLQSAAIVHGIEVYHVKGNGWNDIGYNFLVDRFGQVFEGRYGGVEKNTVGAHSQGFNTGSVGVAVIVTYASTGITQAARGALVKLLAWRLDIAHVDPLSFVNVLSGGNTKYPAGIPVDLRAISGHRDTYLTDCPGGSLYAQLPSIAHAVAASGGPKLYAPAIAGKLGGAIRFTGRLSAAQPWTVSITDATGAVVASGGGKGTAIDWTWSSSLAPAG